MRANAIVGNLFRDKYREILGALTREYGPARLEIIEDAIQEAMLKSLEVWSVGAVPANPGGWLFVTARRRVIDKLRASRRLSHREETMAESVLARIRHRFAGLSGRHLFAQEIFRPSGIPGVFPRAENFLCGQRTSESPCNR